MSNTVTAVGAGWNGFRVTRMANSVVLSKDLGIATASSYFLIEDFPSTLHQHRKGRDQSDIQSEVNISVLSDSDSSYPTLTSPIRSLLLLRARFYAVLRTHPTQMTSYRVSTCRDILFY
jgi:hypothetical protein